MARKEKNIHYIYKTTCDVTGKYYVGMHSTNNLEDGYMGSGDRLRYSIRKYGKDKHTKEILEYLPTREELAKREREIVNKELIKEYLCMNLVVGGEGGRGFTEEERKKAVIESQKKQFLLRQDPEWVKKRGDNISKTVKKQYDTGVRKKGEFCNWTGKNHSEDSKQKISESKKGKYLGENASQHETCWITKEGVNKKIKKETLDEWIPDGWIKGRNYNRWK